MTFWWPGVVHSLGCQEYLEYFGKRIFCKSVISFMGGGGAEIRISRIFRIFQF